MRILYDAIPLLMRSAGVKSYHHALLSRLIPALQPGEIDLFPYLPGLTPNRTETSNYSPLSTKLRLGGMLASNYLGLPLAHPAAARADLFHVTPHFWRPPRSATLTSMIHDPTPVTLPECHTASNIRYFERFVDKTLPRLQAVIAPSHAVKEELTSRFGFAADKIEVIYHGVDEDFFEATPAQMQAAASAYGLPQTFILFVGSLEPRKNLVRLAEAHRKLPEKLQAQYPLVIVGASGWRNDEIRDVLRNTRHAMVVGFVSRKLLPAVYASATLFALPSLYEGFGMPLLEAMAAGVPVLTSDVSAMPEVIGDCGFTVDPYDVTSIAAGLRRALDDLNAAASAASRGRMRARQFTWERCAEQTKIFFEKAAG